LRAGVMTNQFRNALERLGRIFLLSHMRARSADKMGRLSYAFHAFLAQS
jgi:hypothetical protein